MIIIETFARGCDAAISADRSDSRDQDRHLMTHRPVHTPIKHAHFSRWLSTRRGERSANLTQ